MMQIKGEEGKLFCPLFVISASAGTGKTHTLSQRVAKYLLAERDEVPYNDLINILAITFTINASREMKERVLKWLKGLSLCDDSTFKQLKFEKKDEYSKKAEALVNKILSNYKDFQIKTIDSFLTSIFKASAIYFVNTPNFEVALNNKEYLEKAFDLYLDELKDTDNDFFKVLEFINDNESSFSFTPYKKIFDNVKKLYTKESHFPKGFQNKDREKEWQKKKEELRTLCKKIREFIEQNNADCYFKKTGLNTRLEDIERDDFEKLFTREKINGSPVKSNCKDEKIKISLENYQKQMENLIDDSLKIYSENFFYPYIKVLKSFEEKIEFVKKNEEVVFMEDIPKIIYSKLEELNIPDIYIRLGSRLYHYFIDEFQDTSPIQWENLKPLIENSLASGGSLYVVGDTKQAIYGFRDTDYRIMKRLYDEKETFPCVGKNHKTDNLLINYRSGKVILQYVKDVFDEIKKRDIDNEFSDSGLYNWEYEIGKDLEGYVCAKIVYNQKESDDVKEKIEILNIIEDCLKRGYSHNDITILAHKNKEIVEISSWLNLAGIPFLSYSSLDIRERKVIKELFNLLRFLDSPRDNLAFSMFLLGDIFGKLADKDAMTDFVFNNKKSTFLYKEFVKHFPDLWGRYFDEPFRYVGYLPIYELLCFAINNFDLKKNFDSESGAIAKLLEIVKDLEGKGKNSLKELLDFIDSKEEDEYESSRIFELPIPENYDGVKLMTVHKAKGLSAKVVIYLLYGSRQQNDSLKVYEKGDEAYVMKLNKSYVPLKDMYEAVMNKQKINDLNSFYVGLTRAEEELYVIGVGEDKGENNDNKKDRFVKSFPVDLIKEGEFGYKKVGEVKKEGENQKGLGVILSDSRKSKSESPSKLNIEEKRRGEYIHLILSEIYNIDDFAKIDDLANKYRIFYPEFAPDETVKLLQDFLNSPQIKPFFSVDKSKVFLEKGFVDDMGMIRVDRVILKDEEVQIVDFKTGEMEDDYKKQLERYAKAIRDIYGKNIACFILYIDKKEAIKVYEC